MYKLVLDIAAALCYRQPTLMRDTLPNAPTARFTLGEIPATEGPSPLATRHSLLATASFYRQHVAPRNRRKSFQSNNIQISTRNTFPYSQSLALIRLTATLADGHASPSKIAVNPFPSSKLPKLMGTESGLFLLASLLPCLRFDRYAHPILIDTRVEQKMSLTPSPSPDPQNLIDTKSTPPGGESQHP